MSLHDTATPTLLVHDPRALVVRGVGYCRQQPDELLQPRITRQCFDAAGRLAQSWDPRLSNPNLSTGYGLAGQSLLTDSVDAGWQLTLFNEARLPVLAWDSRDSECHTEYDPLQRVTAIHERCGEGSLQTVERMLYGDADATHNRRGQLLRHDTPASSLSIAGYSLLGLPITQATRVLKSLDAPHWPAELPARDDLLDDETFVTEQTYTSLGESQAQTDAMGNLSLFTYTVAGQTKKVGLRLTGAALEWLVSAISYNASGQVEQETAGNGVITTACYAEENGRLQHLLSEDGAGKRLQDLHYTYDPVGNIIRLEDRAQPIRHFNNRKLEPINDYRYDSLYQLVEARGLEVVTPGYGPELPVLQPTPLDPAQLRPYTQTFDYDVAGNLKERHHSNAPTFRMLTSATSNRSLAQRNDGSLPTEADIPLGFDANGNQRQLMPGQQMDWDARNQLSRVTQVAREEEPDDDEHYRYDRPGHRLRTVRMAHTPRRTLRSEVLYLPGLELHRDSASGKEHHVISLQAGRNQVRVLHWTSAPPDSLVNDQLRYSLTDHLGSCAVELDHLGRLISQEWYYAFGGTACWVGRNGMEAKYKTIRYSGKKRDATGLYYYGYRYYAPWLQRWVSPDPAQDGLNEFQMVNNNPINLFDSDGLAAEAAAARWKAAYRGVKAQGVRVRTVAPGIIAVDIRGGNELFNRMGVGLGREIRGDRELTYLSLDSSLRGKIAGGKRMVGLNDSHGMDIKSAAKLRTADAVAYINGGFFNMDGLADPDASDHASIGRNSIDGRARESVDVPTLYKGYYEKVQMPDGSMIQAGPSLASGGQPTFTQDMLEDHLFQFSSNTATPGKLGHAEHPNARSGISRPRVSVAGSRTRLVVGLANSRDTTSPGYTMPEWSRVMARLDRLNISDSSSVNLDGGSSISLGVVGAKGEHLLERWMPGQRGKEVGNFIAFSKPVGFFRSVVRSLRN